MIEPAQHENTGNVKGLTHYSDVIMNMMGSQITSVSIVCSTVGSCADQRKHERSASLAFVKGIHRSPLNSPHKRSVTRKCFHSMTSSCTAEILLHMKLSLLKYFWFRSLLAVANSNMSIEMSFSIDNDKSELGINHNIHEIYYSPNCIKQKYGSYAYLR